MSYNTSGVKEKDKPQGATPTEWTENERILATGSAPLEPIYEYYRSATESPEDRILNLAEFPVVVGALVPVMNMYIDMDTETVPFPEGLLVLGVGGYNGSDPHWSRQYTLSDLDMQ